MSEATAVIQEPVLHAFTNERGVFEDSTYWNPSWTVAQGAVMTTDIGDALASAIAFGSGSLLSSRSHRIQLAPLTAKFRPFSRKAYYGLGILVSNSWILQVPAFSGYSVAILYLPSRCIGIAVTSTNGAETPDEGITNRLGDEIGAFLVPDRPPMLPNR